MKKKILKEFSDSVKLESEFTEFQVVGRSGIFVFNLCFIFCNGEYPMVRT